MSAWDNFEEQIHTYKCNAVQGYLGYKNCARRSVACGFLELRTPRTKPVGLRFLKSRKRTQAVSPRFLKVKTTHKSGRPVFLRTRPAHVRVNVQTLGNPFFGKMLTPLSARKCASSILRGGKRYEAKTHSLQTQIPVSQCFHF